jgi:hypothetical protein
VQVPMSLAALFEGTAICVDSLRSGVVRA